MEVGPLARVLMLYASGDDLTQELVNSTLQTLDVPVREAKTALKTLERLGMVRVQRSRNGGYTYIRTGSHWLRRRWR